MKNIHVIGEYVDNLFFHFSKMVLPEVIPVSSKKYDYYFKFDVVAYTDYFNSIRDYIIEHIDKFSTTSLIRAMESYRKTDEDVRYRIQQAVELYHFCKEHPNNVPENDNDNILGILLVCNFSYDDSSTRQYIEHDIIGEFLNKHDISFTYWRGEHNAITNIDNIGGVLKVLIPEFNVPQPPYHYRKGWVREIEALHKLCKISFDD